MISYGRPGVGIREALSYFVHVESGGFDWLLPADRAAEPLLVGSAETSAESAMPNVSLKDPWANDPSTPVAHRNFRKSEISSTMDGTGAPELVNFSIFRYSIPLSWILLKIIVLDLQVCRSRAVLYFPSLVGLK